MLSTPPNLSFKRLVAYTVLGIALTVATSLATFNQEAGLPETNKLKAVSGTVTWVATYKYGVKFKLSTQPAVFDYPSKSRGNGAVISALTNAGAQTIHILYNPTPRQPLFSEEEHFDVWEVQVGNVIVRSVSDSQVGWRSDNAIAPWLFTAFLSISIYFGVFAWRARPIANQPLNGRIDR
jgi:hypothetical protein